MSCLASVYPLPLARAVLAATLLAACSNGPAPESATPPTATTGSDGSADSTAATAPTQSAPGDDDPDCGWRVEDGVIVEFGEFVPEDDLTARVTPVDLNGSPPSDAVGFLGGCGNWGECQHVVLRACDDGSYEAVWGPEYATAIEVGDPREGTLADLWIGGRTGRAGCDLPLRTTLRWTGEQWQEAGACSGEGVWDSACGERPAPRCDER